MPNPKSQEDGILAANTIASLGRETGVQRTVVGLGQCLSWVKPGNTRDEQMFSASPSKADIAQRSRSTRQCWKQTTPDAARNLGWGIDLQFF
jgi:hypothetical protein